MLRLVLDRFYLYCGYLAAVFMAGIGLCIVAQISWRFFGRTLEATEASGFCLAASIFFGLAHTLRHGSHVRIDLLTARLPYRLRRGASIASSLLGAGVTSYLAWNLGLLALQSFEFQDISPGLLAMPMWIPQSGAAIGVAALAIALIDECFWLIGGGKSRCDTPADADLDASAAS